MVGFDKKIQDKLLQLQDQKEPIVIENCEIIKSKYTDNMEVIVNKSTRFYKSQKKFNVTVEDVMSLDELSDQPNYQCVNVKVKVIEMKKPLEIQPSLKKQDVVIADHTGAARLTLWQQDLNIFDIGGSYSLKNLIVREFNGLKYLSPEKSGWTFVKCPDIGDVHVGDFGIDDHEAEVREIIDAQVVGVYELAIKFACINCTACFNVLNADNLKLGKCTKCKLTQRLDRCSKSLSVKLV